MKTNPAARSLVRVRVIMVCAALVAIAGIEFWTGESLAAHVGQTTARQDDSPSIQVVSISDLIAAAR